MAMEYLPGVATLTLDVTRCTGCCKCMEVCPHGVLAHNGQLREKSKVFIRSFDLCMECGACARNCPVGALHVEAGVGCARGILQGALTGKEACCGEDPDCCG